MHAGFGTADISVYEPGMTLMGWGRPSQQATGVAVPLAARATLLVDGGRRHAFVVLDLMAITQGLREDVLHALATEHADLGLGPGELTLSATHTHSGPSGHGHHFWLHLNAPGFSERVHDTLVARVIDALRAAAADLAPAVLTVHRGELPVEARVAWNRSWFAYSRNVDVTPVPRARRHEATDRVMTLLAARAPDGRLRGFVSWFGLHGTAVHDTNTALHPDHPGLAARAFEAEGVAATFAQGCCGDVSPNHRPDPRRGYEVGPHDDDFDSAAHVADAVVGLARSLLATPGDVVDGLEARTVHTDFSRAPADPAYTADGRGHTTTPARLGLAMGLGTAEGPGPFRPLRRPLAWAHRLRAALDARRAHPTHDPKLPFLDLGLGARGRFAGLVPMARLPAVDPVTRWVRDHVRSGRLGETSWVPDLVPTQLVRLGPLLLCATPFETTTVACRRIEATLREVAPEGVRHVAVASYANAYVGYLTTFEEYQVQHYEAGYTLFGPHSLAALQTAIRDLARGAHAVKGPTPARVAREVLEARRFEAPWPG